MLRLINLLFRILRNIKYRIHVPYTNAYSNMYFKVVGIRIGKNLISKGIPKLDIRNKSIVKIGDNFKMNNGINYNIIGRQQKCIFVVLNGAKLVIGNNVGISSTAIICYKEIIIGDNVKIGGNTVIYDSDFHSLNYLHRRDGVLDSENINNKGVKIGNDVFIGAHTTILKGIVIGDRSIVGAGSVVTKSIPNDEIWAGNPAKFIRKL